MGAFKPGPVGGQSGRQAMAAPATHGVEVAELGPQKFSLVVIFDGRRFDCGLYINRAEALKAGRLFVERKQGEQSARGKRPGKKR
jgi:hypothetical protein